MNLNTLFAILLRRKYLQGMMLYTSHRGNRFNMHYSGVATESKKDEVYF